MIDIGEEDGCVFMCDEQTTTRHILHDSIGLGEGELLGRPFTSLVERSALEKALNFLIHVQTESAAFNWQITVQLSGALKNLFFAGVMTPGGMLIIAAASRRGQFMIYDRYVKGSIDLEPSVLEKAQALRDQACQDEEFFENLTRLNNELANLQRELYKKNAQLQKLDQLKNEFLGVAAHDLRSPLTTIEMYSSYLQDVLSEKLSEEEMAFLDIIRSSSTYMLALVNDLLDITRIESGKLQLSLEEGDVCMVAMNVIRLNRAPASRKKLDIQLHRDEVVPAVRFDRLRLEQVLHNLLDNAIKFSCPESTILVGIHHRGEDVLITVKDHGRGISQEQSQRLFDMFERAQSSGTGGEKGSGLGLAIAKKIVLSHGGSIWVESEEGRGTTLCFTLPVADP
jgi:signal transduction histidine kinase